MRCYKVQIISPVHIDILEVTVLDFDLAGVAYSTNHRVIDKLRKAGAVSRDKAVTPEIANLNLNEIEWLEYFAGGFLATIKKTRDGRYYV